MLQDILVLMLNDKDFKFNDSYHKFSGMLTVTELYLNEMSEKEAHDFIIGSYLLL